MMELKRPKPRWHKYVLAILCVLLGAGIIFAGFMFLKDKDLFSFLRKEETDLSDKTVGVLQTVDKEEDEYILSLKYPKTDIKELDDSILKYLTKIRKSIDKDEKYLYRLDYTSDKYYERYISVHFTLDVLKKDKVQSTSFEQFVYDVKLEKMIQVKDVFRLNYEEVFLNDAKVLYPETNFGEEFIKGFKFYDKGVILYLDDAHKMEMDIPFKKYERYIRIQGKGVSSLAPKKVMVPKKYEIDPDKKMIALTFDDGPNPGTTDKILDALAEVDGRATFYMVAGRIPQYGLEDIVTRMYKDGHEMGNHTLEHQFLTELSEEEMRRQVYEAQDIFFKLCGMDAPTLRPPGGFVNDMVRKIVPEPIVLWHVDTLDWKNRDKQMVYDTAMRYAYDGAIVLMHDIYETSADAAVEMIYELDRQGYQLVTVSDIMKYRE